MSKKYPGGIITKSPATPTGPAPNGSAPGIWTLDQANYWITQGVWPTPYTNFVEDVFSTTVYTGTGSFRGIDVGLTNLSSTGGLFWFKARSNNPSGFYNDHYIFDTNRNNGSGGGGSLLLASTLSSNTNSGQLSTGNITVYNTSTIVTSSQIVNDTNINEVVWTFKEAPKFLDIVSYTGDGNANQTISHNLGITPGLIIVKGTNTSSDWSVYHRSSPTPNSTTLALNTTAAATTYSGQSIWNVTSTTFNANRDYGNVNAGGGTYIAYVFAHDPSSSGIIKCGSFTTDGSGNGSPVSLDWEPQWVTMKASTTTSDWLTFDNMRGWTASGSAAILRLNSSNSETSNNGVPFPNSTGFGVQGLVANATYVYVAIRRGPMRIPTLGTTVFAPVTYTGNGGSQNVTTNFAVDMSIGAARVGGYNFIVSDRLRGGVKGLFTQTTSAEPATNYQVSFASNTAVQLTGATGPNSSGVDYVDWAFKRAPGFFDEVCWTGTGVAGQALNHNLAVTPELIISKTRGVADSWNVWAGNVLGARGGLVLNSTAAVNTSYFSAGTAPSSTVFYTAYQAGSNTSTNVAYLFASCPGVSKVGSYTGNGSFQTINCGFTTGARFVLIKRTDNTGDWLVFDAARGIVSANDPYLALNNTNAEDWNGTADSVDTDSSGFKVDQIGATNVNVNGATYIFLAVA